MPTAQSQIRSVSSGNYSTYIRRLRLRLTLVRIIPTPSISVRRNPLETLLEKPGLMRWDYRKLETKVFVSNGDDLWVYEPNKNQAHRKSLRESEIPIAISFLMGEGNLLDEFTPNLVSVADSITLDLKPKQPSRHYKQVGASGRFKKHSWSLRQRSSTKQTTVTPCNFSI